MYFEGLDSQQRWDFALLWLEVEQELELECIYLTHIGEIHIITALCSTIEKEKNIEQK